MSRPRVFATLTLAAVLGAAPALPADPPGAPEAPSLGTIRGLAPEQAKAAALGWLKAAGADAAAVQKADAVWTAGDRPVLDRVADTLALGNAEAAKLVAALRDPASPNPTEIPAVLKDGKQAPFFRANLGVYAAKLLAGRRLHEEALAALKLVQPEQVVDPASYYFYKAVCENKLLMKEEGLTSVHRLLSSVADAPERYTVLAGLMKEEMEAWEDKDLGHVARKMEEVEGRLDNARGGPKTQQKQKEIISLLDKLIEDLEKQCNGNGGGASSSAPRSNMPLQDSRIMGGAGEGKVDNKKLVKDAQRWGAMPEKEKVKALEAISRDMPPHIREAAEEFSKKINSGAGGR
jgi:hypothetical protein